MTNYLDNIKSKGWDKFFLEVETEFKHIREELSVVSDNVITVTSILASGTSNNADVSKFLIQIKNEEEVRKEFVKVREELNIDSFVL